MKLRSVTIFVWAATLGLALLGCERSPAKPEGKPWIAVFVPCGMEAPFAAAKTEFERAHTGETVELILDHPAFLLKRMADGERPDVIVTPGRVEIDTVVNKGLVAETEVRAIGRYQLVLFVQRDNPVGIKNVEDLVRPEVKEVALVDPKGAAVGLNAQQALEKLGVWDQVKPKIVIKKRMIDAYIDVGSGRAQAGFGYNTCPFRAASMGSSYSRVQIAWALPDNLHDPASVFVAVTKAAPERALAEEFVAFVVSEKGQALLEERGLTTPVAQPAAIPGAPETVHAAEGRTQKID